MPENETVPGKKQAVTSLILAAVAFLNYMFVPMFITPFFTLILGIIGLVQAIRARKLGYRGLIREAGMMLSIIDIAASVLMIGVLVSALIGMGGEPIE